MNKLEIAKLVVGIIAIVIGTIALIDSFTVSAAEDVLNTFLDANITDSGLGMLTALILIANGVCGICLRRTSRVLNLVFAILLAAVASFCVAGGDGYWQDLPALGVFTYIIAAADVVFFRISIQTPKDTPVPVEPTPAAQPATEPTVQREPDASSKSNIELLIKYKQLLDAGAITENEYNTKKAELLK